MPKTLRVLACVSLLCAIAVGCGDGSSEGVGSNSAPISGENGVDYSFARPSPSGLASQGYKFAARYVSPEASKNLSASEAQALVAAGLDIVVVWEDGATNSLGGFSQGASDAQAAVAQAAACGEPSDRPIYFAVDFDASSSDASAIDAYFDGVASVIGTSRTGVYGGVYAVGQLFGAGKVAWGWQTYAWSNGAWDSRAQLRQVENGVDGDCCDLDQSVAADFGQWGPAPPYAAAYVSQSFPLATTALTMVEGQTIPSFIEMKNVGAKAWDTSTHLGTTEPRDRSSVFADGTWLSANRPSGVTSGTVAPGGTYKFAFDLHAPDTPGTYYEHFGLVEDGVAWFGDPGQGGPPDSDLEVQVSVVAPEYSSGSLAEAGPPPSEDDAGATEPPAAGDFGFPQDDASPDASATSSAWNEHGHGCSTSTLPADDSDASALLGLAMSAALGWRRWRRRR